jgi:diguanylate cyclase (GGDEF)-like protein
MKPEKEHRIPIADLLVFHQLTHSLTSSFELDAILRTILDQMERMIDADLWTLLMVDEERHDLYYAIAGGGEESSLQGLRVKIGEGVAGWVVEHGQTLIVPESEKDERVTQALPAATGKSAPVRSVIALPLRGRKGIHGAIEIFNPHAGQMTDYTIAFLHILADHAAIAIENSRAMARIQQLSITDDATGLYNARYLYEVLGRELERSRQTRTPVSLAFIDLDRFKRVNDEHGHLVGSELLSRVGLRLRQLSRAQDLCFRYGGDEFVILLPGTEAAEGLKQIEALHKALIETVFQMNEALALRVSASIGFATSPLDGAAVHAVIGAADARMYAVKMDGRGQVRGA